MRRFITVAALAAAVSASAVAVTNATPQGYASALSCSGDTAQRLVQATCWYTNPPEIGHRVIGYAKRPGSTAVQKYYGPFVGSGGTSAVTLPSIAWNAGWRFYGRIVDGYRT
jgi:hypothetical protein